MRTERTSGNRLRWGQKGMSQSDKQIVRFNCPQCGKLLRAAAEHAGRRSKCTRCQTVVVIPEAEYRLSDTADQPPRQPPLPKLKVICPVCRTVMQANADQVGQTVQCPDCGTRSTVVAPVARPVASPREADDLYAVADDVPPSERTYIPLRCPVCHTLMQAEPHQIGRPMECPDCGTKTVVPKPVTVAVQRAPRTPESIGTYGVQEKPGQPDADSPAYEAHFPVYCPRCSTRLLATRQQLGTRLTCPDCGTGVPVPPLDEIQVRMAAERAEVLPSVKGYAVKVSPDGPSPAARQPASAVAGVHMPTLLHGQRPEMVAHPFWQGNLMPIFQTPGWCIWVGLTFAATMALGLAWAAMTLGKGEAGGGFALVGPWITSLILTTIGSLILLIWAGAASFVGLAILRDTAAGNERIENWPNSFWIDELAQILFVINSVTLTAAAVYGLHRLLALVGLASGWIELGAALALFPYILLSMLETDSCIWPFSLPTFQSLFHATGGWLEFHAASLLTLAPLGALAMGIDWLLGGWGILFYSAILSAGGLIYFRLLGRLAWYCAEHSPRIGESDEDGAT